MNAYKSAVVATALGVAGLVGAQTPQTAPASAPAAPAVSHGTPQEAEAMVQKAQELIRTKGEREAFKTFTFNPGATFKDRDLYVFVYSFDGYAFAHGADSSRVGGNFRNYKDSDGVLYIQGMIDMVKQSKKGWYGPYKIMNFVTRVNSKKKAYCEEGAGKVKDIMVCVGAYD